MKLLGIDTNAKTVKGQKLGYMTGIMYLAPSNESGKNLCPHASDGCKAACLYTAGRGRMAPVKKARLAKTHFFIRERATFLSQLKMEIVALVKRAAKNNMIPAVRLNGTSDLPWENLGVIQEFPDVQFYDYTKNLKRMVSFVNGELPKNYHLTFSRSETTNGAIIVGLLRTGGNVAMVYAGKPPSHNFGATVVSGDESDLRFLDAKGVIVALTAKGDGKKDKSGFVVK